MDVGKQVCSCSCQFLLLFCWWWSLLLNHLESPYERASRNGNVPMKRHSATNIVPSGQWSKYVFMFRWQCKTKTQDKLVHMFEYVLSYMHNRCILYIYIYTYREHETDGSTYPCCGKGSFAGRHCVMIPGGTNRSQDRSTSRANLDLWLTTLHDTGLQVGVRWEEHRQNKWQWSVNWYRIWPLICRGFSMELGQQSLPEVRQTTNPNHPLTICHFPNILHEQMSATCQTCHLTSSHLKDPIHFAAHIWKSRFTNLTTSISGKVYPSWNQKRNWTFAILERWVFDILYFKRIIFSTLLSASMFGALNGTQFFHVSTSPDPTTTNKGPGF